LGLDGKKFFSRIRLLGGGAVDKSLRSEQIENAREAENGPAGSTWIHPNMSLLGVLPNPLAREWFAVKGHNAQRIVDVGLRDSGDAKTWKSVMAHPHTKGRRLSRAGFWLTKVIRRSCGSPSTLLKLNSDRGVRKRVVVGRANLLRTEEAASESK
jgi:hypothetical protein